MMNCHCLDDDSVTMLLQGPVPAVTPQATKAPSTLTVIPMAKTVQLFTAYVLGTFTASVRLQVSSLLLEAYHQKSTCSSL